MKGSTLMFFGYLAMIGVPVLLLLLALSSFVFPHGAVGNVLIAMIGVGAIVYGAIGLREVYIHGGKKRERDVRQGNESH